MRRALTNDVLLDVAACYEWEQWGTLKRVLTLSPEQKFQYELWYSLPKVMKRPRYLLYHPEAPAHNEDFSASETWLDAGVSISLQSTEETEQ